MGRIVVLDKNMINMIAAGEVVERPASVVKELMENSIDAGAKRIVVEVEDGGRKLIAVRDNGVGMEPEDLARAFEPHATSKVKTSVDLHCISTLGFRGEALASIASVAQVRTVTRQEGVAEAYCLEIDSGDTGEVMPCSGDYGTSIEVRELFYKLPARRKFLRTASTEMGHISEYFTRIALAHEELELTLVHNGRQLYRLEAGESLVERIGKLFSQDVADGLMTISREEKGMGIRALLGRPEIARSSTKFQYVFLNGRFIRDKFISHAIREGFRGSIDPTRSPVVFIYIRMPFEDYDVNVHPTKTEVRFFNSNLIHSQVLACIREKLLGTHFEQPAAMPSADGGVADDSREGVRQAMDDFLRKYRGSSQQTHLNFGGGGISSGSGGGFGGYGGGGSVGGGSGVRHDIGGDERYVGEAVSAASSKYLQVHNSYILAETAEGFVIVDQHALHERILYEDLRRRFSAGKLESQKLLIPESFEVTDAEAAALGENGDFLEQLGIEVESFGPRSFAVHSFPTILAKANIVELMRELLDIAADSNGETERTELVDRVLHMAACKAAVKAGQRLSEGEMRHLIENVDGVERSGRCPHGRPTTISFSVGELEKQFKRT